MRPVTQNGPPPDGRASLRPGGGHVPMATDLVDRTLADAIESTVKRHPDRIAVRAAGQDLRYADLDRAANRVAHALVGAGVLSAEPVVVVARQTAEQVVAILGVLKAGAAYVPVDPTQPASRGLEVVARLGARTIVADPASRAEAAALPGRQVVATLDPGGPPAPPPRVEDPDAMAYVYFTSGSTGRPKGVMDTHRNVLDNVRRYTDSLAIGPEDRLSLLQAIAFSGAVSSLFAALVTGATSLPFDVRTSGLRAMRDWVAEERLTMFHAVPILFRALADGSGRYRDLRVVRLEGDAAAWSDAELARACLDPSAVLVNGLGATETGLVRQFFVDRRTSLGSGALPLGYPVPGVEVRLEDDEIVVVGARLATGYWDDPERTASAFADLGDGRRAYRTGDLGRLDPDGRLIGLGRRDQAEKIRGETVDLAEVEARLRSRPGVADAVAITRRDGPTEARLVAYVVPAPGHRVEPPALRRALAAVLPATAVPATIVPLEAIPLDHSAKVDRAALPSPTRMRPDLVTPYRPASDDLERDLVAIWEDVLGLHPIGVDDEFFDLGGDSLDAARLVTALAGLASRDVADDAILTASTVADLAQRMRSGPTTAPIWYAIHEDPGNDGFYAHVARAADAAIDVRTIGPGPGIHRSVAVDELAAEAVGRIRAMSPDGPYRVLGFCFAATVALEVAHRLQAAGEEVDGIALLAISPLEFPGLVDRGAVLREDRARRFRQRARAHIAEVRRLGIIDGARHLRGRTIARSERVVRHVAGAPDPVGAKAVAARSHRARPFDGRVLVILGRGSAAVYTRSPEAAWRGIGRATELTLLPGDDHAMLVGEGARDLARILVHASARTDDPGHAGPPQDQ